MDRQPLDLGSVIQAGETMSKQSSAETAMYVASVSFSAALRYVAEYTEAGDDADSQAIRDNMRQLEMLLHETGVLLRKRRGT